MLEHRPRDDHVQLVWLERQPLPDVGHACLVDVPVVLDLVLGDVHRHDPRAQLRATILREGTRLTPTDVGDEFDKHPKRKEPVGGRLALAARAVAYGEKIVYSGPIYKSMKVEGNEAILSFDHVGSGLAAKGGALAGFWIAGPDKKFVPAVAEIRGDNVAVFSSLVTFPVAVRFGWADYPVVNFFNKDGLPASPFRTDFAELWTTDGVTALPNRAEAARK